MTGLERTYALVEQAIGRPLRDAEKAIDVLRLDAALELAKQELEDAIRAEMLRATRAWARAGGFGAPRLTLTKRMRRPLEELHRLGRQEAALELDRLGYQGIRRPDGRTRPRRYAAPNPNPDPRPAESLDEAIATVARGLPGIAVRIEDELVTADLTAAASSALAQALLRIPGARDLASRVISTALYSGLGLTFEENAGLVDDVGDGSGGGWERTAVMDGATCGPCAADDGKVFATWSEAMVDLPGGGPAVNCQGGGRCRCRLVPIPKP